MPLSDRQAVELFHLQVLRILTAGPDKERLAIKGGCNLRFFFGSARYSEDMDLDVFGISRHVLTTKVDRILDGAPLRLALRSKEIEVTASSAPKQTDTTQRWKIELSVMGRAVPVRTKLEFSRRRAEGAPRVEAIDRALLAEYQLLPVVAPHYGQPEAIQQKISALVGRTAVQARDVFDLAVLFSRGGDLLKMLAPVRATVSQAIERAMEISYGSFRSQVVAYLTPLAVDEYGNPEAWDALQASVISTLEAAAR